MPLLCQEYALFALPFCYSDFQVTKVTKTASIFNASVYGERKENQRADKGQTEAFAERQYQSLS